MNRNGIRITYSVGVIVLIFGSLITFPAHTHWIASVWLLLSLIAFANKKPMWPWLVGCVAIIAIKRPGFTPEFWMLSVVFIIVAIADWRLDRDKPESFNIKRFVIYAFVLIGA